MEEVIKVKEEPLDSDSECVDQQECKDLRQETTTTTPLLLTSIKVEKELDIKTECEETFDMESMQVVDEQPNFITVKAFDSKSADEKQFIKSMDEQKSLHSQRKRKKPLTLRRCYEQHMDIAVPVILEPREKCTVCPFNFATKIQLQDHLALHKLNRYFCAKHCGRHFDVIDDCEIHEFRHNGFKDIFCSICDRKFFTFHELRKHWKTHDLVRRFVCSFCRKFFECSIDLAKHWQVNNESCGILMQDIVRDTIAAIESSLPVFNSNAAGPEKRLRTKKKKGNKTTTVATSSLPNEPALKHIRLAADIRKSNEFSSLYVPLNDVKIKDEPKLYYKNLDDLDSTSELKRVIKTEKEDSIETNIQVKQEPNPDVSNNSIFHKPAIVSTITNMNGTMPKLVPRPNINAGSVILPASATLPFSTSVHNISLPPTTNLRLVRLPNLQPAPILRPTITPISTMPTLKPLQLQNQNITIPPINLKGFKIYKIMPNAKLMPLPAKGELTTISPTPTATVIGTGNVEKPIVLKLKNPPLSPGSMTLSPELTVTKPAITLQLNSLATNTTIDAEDLKKLVNEAAAAASSSISLATELRQVKHRRKQIDSKSRFELNIIESLPQKRELIENLKQQIKNIEGSSCKREMIDNLKQEIKGIEDSERDFVNNITLPTAENLKKIKNELEDHYDNSDSNNCFVDLDDFESKPLIIDENADSMASCSDYEEFELSSSVSTNSFVSGELRKAPPTLFIPIVTDCDPELAKMRKTHMKEYRYVWMCPRCPRCYGQKHSFRGHLVSAHGFCKEEFNNLIIEVKPVPCVKSLEEIAEKHSPKLKSESNLVVKEKIEVITPDIIPSSLAEAHTIGNKHRKSNTRFTCAKCGRTCSTRTALNDHVAANCSREPQYPCTSCPKKFYSASTLNSHLSIHTGDLPHKCSYCDKRFRTRGQVTVHHRTHTGERPFACQVCNQRFTHRETLISHLSRHIGMKRYKCYACQQQFSCISGLKTHREIRFDSCGKVKLNTRAVGPRVRVIKGNVIFEEQPVINPYLRTEDPDEILAEINQNT